MPTTIGSPWLQGVSQTIRIQQRNLTGCRLKTKPIGIKSCMAQVC